MTTTNVFHALGLHMHQPSGNLQLLLDSNPWEAEQIIRCYERPVRYARQYADVARLHIGFSGILLEQLRDPRIIDRYRHLIDLPAMLDAYRDADTIELIGMGYFHPIFPLIPVADWEEQLRTGRELMREVFGRAPRGFWPPEMAFSMEMIPALAKAGYEYVVVDGVHVHPEDGVSDVFRPYLACYDGACITVVPRDRDVSNAQQSGLDATWFAHEVTHRCRFSARPDEPRLVTTWSDGENGGWFRQMHEGSGFFGHYLSPYMEHVRGGEYPVTPVSISDYLRDHAPSAYAQVQTGAWNVGSTSGYDLSQWAGSGAQQVAAETVSGLSRRWWALARLEDRLAPAVRPGLAEARRLVLESETSCYLFWGDEWLPKLRIITDAASLLLDELEAMQQAADRSAVIAPVAEPTVATPASDAGKPIAAKAQDDAKVEAEGSSRAAVSQPAPAGSESAPVGAPPVAERKQSASPDRAAPNPGAPKPAAPNSAAPQSASPKPAMPKSAASEPSPATPAAAKAAAPSEGEAGGRGAVASKKKASAKGAVTANDTNKPKKPRS